MNYFSIYLEFARIQFRTQISHRGAFTIKFISKIFGWGWGFALLGIMLSKFQSINGWSTYEVMFLYAMDVLAYSIIATFLIGPSDNLQNDVETGRFDEVLTKPLNNFLYYAFRKTSSGYISNYILCIIIMSICIKGLDISLNPVNILFLVVAILGGALITGAGMIISIVPSFWMVKSNNLADLLYGNAKSFIRYPISAYNKGIQVLLTLVFPYAFINFYPAQYFLNKNDFMMFHPVFQFLTPVVGIVMFALAYAFWKYGINRYSGAGS